MARSTILAYQHVGSYQQILGASSLVMKAHHQIRNTANTSQVRTWYYDDGGRHGLCALLRAYRFEEATEPAPQGTPSME